MKLSSVVVKAWLLGRKTGSRSVLIVHLFTIAIALGFPRADSVYPQETSASKAAGRIAGKVRLEGHFKKPPPLKVFKNRDFCGSEVPNKSLLVGPDGAVQNAVIVIPGARRERTESPLKALVLDNKNCAFVPHVQVAPVGSELLLLNNDPILHDVHARLGSETLFNVGLPTWRQVKKRLTRTGIVTIECDVLHTWMSAYILVTSSPHFTVTDEKGEFAIDGIAAGTYEIEVWHEKLGSQSRRVTVTAGSTLRVDFIYRLTTNGPN